VLTDTSNIALTWSELSQGDEEGFAPVTGYNLYWDSNGFVELRVTINDADILFYSETDVENGKIYQF
jgi:hypothetical protein